MRVQRSSGSWVSLWLVACLGVALSLPLASVAEAQNVTAAAAAFRRGQEAELSESWAEAAEFYELAQSLAPSPEALRSALRNRRRANQLGIAAQHAERLLAQYPTDGASRELGEATLAELRPQLGRIDITCGDPCRVLVDTTAAGVDLAQTHVVYVMPGGHSVAARYSTGESVPQLVEPAGGEIVALTFVAPPPPPEPPPNSGPGAVADSGGISPWFFISGVVLTVGAGAAATAFGLVTLDRHDMWTMNMANRTLYDQGRDSQLLTNVFFGATGVFAVTSLVLAFLTDWDGTPERSPDVSFDVSPEGVRFTAGGRF